MRFKTIASILAFFLFILVAQLPVLAQFSMTDPVPADPAVRIGKLPNGLSYYIRKNTRPEKKVELRLVVNVGSIQEDPDQLGLAHFMEHMNFNGSKHFPKNELVEYLQSIGVEFGADLNAYTSFDETVYILPVPSDDSVKLEKAFLVLEDWAGLALLDPGEIEKERGVVLEESRLGRGAGERMRNIYLPMMLNGSLYAQRLPIGKDSILSGFSYETLRRFYTDWYRPNLMAVVVVGDIDPNIAEAMIRKHFSAFTNPANPRPRPSITPVPGRTKDESVVLTDKEQPYTVLSVIHNLEPESPVRTWGDYRKNLVQALYNTMLNLRYEELTQQAKPPFSYGNSGSGSFLRGYKGQQSFALLSDAPVQDAVNALINTRESARKFGFLPGELERAKKNLLTEAERAVMDKNKTESGQLVDPYVDHFLSGTPIPGVEQREAFLKAQLPGISLAEINQLAASLKPAQGEFAYLLAPDGKKTILPSSAGLMAAIDKADALPVQPYTEKVVASSLMKSKPVPGKIISSKQVAVTGTTDFVLSNGITVTLKPTDFKNDEILLQMGRQGGYHAFPLEMKNNARYAAQAVAEMGVAGFTPTDLRKALAGKTVQVQPFASQDGVGITARSSVRDLETMFQLVHLYVVSPVKNKDLFQAFVTKEKSFLENMKNDPTVFFQDTLSRIQFGNHPWVETLLTPADYDRLDLDKTFAAYQQMLGDAGGMHLTIVGNTDEKTLRPLLEQYIGSLPAKQQPVKPADVGLRPVRGVVNADIFKGTPADKKSMVSLFFSGNAPYSYENLFYLLALTDVANIIIIRELREAMSGIYGGGMYGTLVKQPYQHYLVEAGFPCGPENVKPLTDSLFSIIRKLRTTGCTQADLDKVKESWKNQRRERIRENGYWRSQLHRARIIGEDPASFLQHDKLLEKLTVEDIRRAAQLYLDEKNYVRGVLYPEKE